MNTPQGCVEDGDEGLLWYIFVLVFFYLINNDWG